MRASVFAFLVGVCLTNQAAASFQDSIAYPRANRLTTRVVATASALGGDTILVTHSLHNDSTSEQKADKLLINTPVNLISTGGPAGEFWFISTGVLQDSLSVAWVTTSAAADVAPRDSASGFFHSAIGVVGVVRYYVQGYVRPPSTGDTLEIRIGRRQPVWRDSYQGWTIAVVPLPTNMTPLGLVLRLESLTDQTCQLDWIRNDGICNSLEAKQRAARRAIERGQLETGCNDINALINELNALPDSQIKPEARSLLILNSRHFVRTHCP